MRGPENPTRGGSDPCRPKHPPGPSRLRPQGLPLASEGIIMKFGSWPVDSPSPRELGFSLQTGDSGMGRGCRRLTAVEFPRAPLSSGLEIRCYFYQVTIWDSKKYKFFM